MSFVHRGENRMDYHLDDPFFFCKFATVFAFLLLIPQQYMEKNVEELKLILDVAANSGKMQAQNEMLLEKIARLEKDNKRLENENKKLKNDLADKTKECEDKDQRIAELEARAMYEIPADNPEAGCQSPVVMVNNFYYVLSWPKTVAYVGTLDTDGRLYASHFIHQTLPDGIPIQFINKVDNLTRLEARQDQRLADAMEKVAERPTTQNIVYPQDGSTANVGCEMQSPEFKMFPLSGAPVQQTTRGGGLSNE